MIRITLILLLAVLDLGAASYYVDFQNGNNSNAGTSSSAPWKHCPGDANATGTPGSTTLAAGDIVYFTNRYEGRILAQTSGTAGSRIIYDGSSWGGVRTILDGTTNATWTQCTAEGTGATEVQNANFASIYYAPLPTGFDYNVPVIEGTNVMTRAGSPNTVEPFLYNNTDYFQAISSGISSGSCTDSGFFTQSDANYWVGAVIVFHATGNSTGYGIITNFNTATDTVQYSSASTPFQATDVDNKYHYTVINSQRQITQGTFAIDTVGGRILVWPSSDINNVRYGARSYGFHSNGKSYLTIRGFSIRGQYGTTFEQGRAITGTSSTATDGLDIHDNEVYGTREGGATATIYTLSTFAGTSNNVVRQNLIRHVEGRGIFGSGNGFIFQSNELTRVTGTVLYSLAYSGNTNRNGQYLDNYIHDCYGTHANGMTIYGISTAIADGFVVARNRVIRQYQTFGPYAVSLQYHRNIHLENNVLDGGVADDGSGGNAGAYMRWLNCTVTKTLRCYGTTNYPEFLVANCILLGGLANGTGEPWSGIVRSNNVYETLSFRQDSGYGWSMETGGFVTNSTALFGGAFTDGVITTSSAAYNAGVDLSNKMLVDTDVIRTARPQGAAWDIGAYEATSGGGSSRAFSSQIGGRGVTFGGRVEIR